MAKRKTAKIPYEQKESYKWVEAAVAERMQDKHQRCISVCDREADVIEYLNYKHRQQRFLVRAKSIDARRLANYYLITLVR